MNENIRWTWVSGRSALLPAVRRGAEEGLAVARMLGALREAAVAPVNHDANQ